jgi:hypothetical protein
LFFLAYFVTPILYPLTIDAKFLKRKTEKGEKVDKQKYKGNIDKKSWVWYYLFLRKGKMQKG